ncbi:MAG: hypothetical protein CM15mP47_5210 [Methanobacteriota archaeon]|nr:MAG: hypothetical protein CM15mP47_5210 [Euryarchaeota archaeon]
MDWIPDEETETMLAHGYSKCNRIFRKSAAPGSVIGRIMSMRQDLRPYGKILSPIIAQKSLKQMTWLVNKGLDYLKNTR